jgi:hypothetical protein
MADVFRYPCRVVYVKLAAGSHTVWSSSYGVILWEAAFEERPDLLSVNGLSTQGPFLTRLLNAWDQGCTLPFSNDSADNSQGLTPATRMPDWYRELGQTCLDLDSRKRPEFDAILALLGRHDQAGDT